MAEESHETKIVVGGDASGALGAFAALKAALGKVGSAIRIASSALAKLNWAVGGIQMLIEGYKKLRDAINETAKRAEEFARAVAFEDAKNAIDRMASSQKKYNDALKESLGLLRSRNELEDMERSSGEKIEDAKIALERAKQVALTPEREKELRQQWRVEDERRNRDREQNRLGEQADRERRNAGSYTTAAEAADLQAKKARDAAKQIMSDSASMSPEDQEKAVKERDALLEKAKAAEEEAKLYRREAQLAHERADLYDKERENLRALESIAAAQNESEDIKDEHDKAKAEREAKAKSEQEKTDREIEESKKRKDAEEKKALDEKEKRADEFEAYSDRLAATEGPTQNRLTAMGLGSGVEARSPVASDVRKIVDLLREEVAATKERNSSGALGAATYAE